MPIRRIFILMFFSSLALVQVQAAEPIMPSSITANVTTVVNKAVTKPVTKPVNNAVGLNAGTVVGNGILFRHYLNQSYLQATFAGYVDKPSDESYLNFSASFVKYISIIRRVNTSSAVGLKWVSGFGVVYDKYLGVTDNKINIGSGIGLDFGAVNKPGLIYSLNAIYTASFDGLSTPEFSTLSFKPTFGVLYNFN